MSRVDYSIANAVNEIVRRFPNTPVELAQMIGAAIFAERQRCADIARKHRRETGSLLSMPPQSAAAAAIERGILSGEAS